MSSKEEKAGNISLEAQKMLLGIQQGSFIFEGEDTLRIAQTIEEFAKSLFCTLGSEGKYCGRCNDCHMLQKGSHPDLHWIMNRATSSSIKIGDIRWLREYTNLKPYQAQKKIFVIQDAQRLTVEAANALLKTLEEPPQDTVIILIVNSANRLLPTVISRCKLIRFPQNILPEHKNQDDTEKFAERFINEDTYVQRIKLYEDIGALERSQLEDILHSLIYVLRDIQLVKLNVGGIVFMSGESEQKLREWAENFSLESVEQIIDDTLRIQHHINKNANIKLAIDSLCKLIARHKLVKTGKDVLKV